MAEPELNEGQRQALAEYVIRQQKAGRKELPVAEIEIVIEAIRATFATLPVRLQRGTT